MSLRKEQCDKVCRILDDVLANRPTERDSLIVAVRKAFAQPKRGKWIQDRSGAYCCSECMEPCAGYIMGKPRDRFCKMCGAKMHPAVCIAMSVSGVRTGATKPTTPIVGE